MTMKMVTNKALGPRLFHVKAGERKGPDGTETVLDQVVLQPGESMAMDLHDENGIVLSEWKEKGEVEIGSKVKDSDMSAADVRRGRGRPRITDVPTENVQPDAAITAPFDKAQQDAGAIEQQTPPVAG